MTNLAESRSKHDKINSDSSGGEYFLVVVLNDMLSIRIFKRKIIDRHTVIWCNVSFREIFAGRVLMAVVYIDPEQRKREKPFTDLSVWSLIISNLLVGVWAIIAGWSLAWMMWIYLIQSVSIGFFWIIRICRFPGVIDDLRDEMSTGQSGPVGFIFGYAAFHLILGGILWCHFLEQKPTIATFCAGGIFFLNGLISFIRNKVPEHKERNLIKYIEFPIFRIFPIHVTMYIGAELMDHRGIEFGGTITVVVFVLLKAIVDVIMYLIERGLFYQPRKYRV